MSQLLIHCKHCHRTYLEDHVPDRCIECRSYEIEAHEPRILDPANPSNFDPQKKTSKTISLPPQKPSYTSYGDFEWNGFNVVTDPYMPPDTIAIVKPQASSATVDSKLYEFTMSGLEKIFNQAVKDMNYKMGVDWAADSQLTKEWHAPDPAVKSQRIEFPSTRKIVVK